MRRTTRAALSTVAVLAAGVLPAAVVGAAPGAAGPAAAPVASATGDYVVLFRRGASPAEARAAIQAAGGRVVYQSREVGFAVVRAPAGFVAEVGSSEAIEGAVRDRSIGQAPRAVRPRADVIEKLLPDRKARTDAPAGEKVTEAAVAAEPLANRQWDMRMMGATPTGSYAREQGQGVRVGIIDTGVDGTHPDIEPNFDAELSANFVTDNPSIDGECEFESCVDPADHDDNGHGTHVASTIGSPINAIGIAGVAPEVELVNLRAGQDSGYFFLAPTLEAITYAGDIDIDVINMSFYTDPWLFNCTNNPADSPAAQTEQRIIREATQRALNYARSQGVLPVAALGNELTDLGNPTTDDTSPDFPPGAAYERDINNSCIDVPTESRGVMGVASVGPTSRMAYYSNYGREQNDVSAPGGDAYDTPLGTLDPTSTTLAAYPENVAEDEGTIDPDGTPNTDFVVADCSSGTCSYYQYLQGTSMAAPHAAGVAALVVGRYGHQSGGDTTLAPSTTQARVQSTAVDHACPVPRTYTWTRTRPSGEVVVASARCLGPIHDNGFYGDGIVNAYAAVTRP